MEAIFEILVVRVTKTADGNFFLEIFEKMYMMVMYLLFFVAVASKIMTGGAILHFPI